MKFPTEVRSTSEVWCRKGALCCTQCVHFVRPGWTLVIAAGGGESSAQFARSSENMKPGARGAEVLFNACQAGRACLTRGAAGLQPCWPAGTGGPG